MSGERQPTELAEALPNKTIVPSGYRLAQDQLGILRLQVRDGITGHWYVLPTVNIRYDPTTRTPA